MKRWKTIVPMLLALLPLTGWGQDDDNGFTADRPGRTPGVSVLPKGRVQWETAVEWERHDFYDIAFTVWTLNSTVLRWGLFDRTELQLTGDWIYQDYEGQTDSDLTNLTVGAKTRLYDGGKIWPAVALQTNVFIPSRRSDFLPDNWGVMLALAFENALTKRLTLGYGIDLSWIDSPRATNLFGAYLTYQVNDRLSLLAEEYNVDHPEEFSSWVMLGVMWQLSKRMQIDIATEFSMNDFSDDKYLTVGLAWQLTER